MAEPFENIKLQLAREIDCDRRPEIVPLRADPWIVSSVLQKSIRRCEIEIAERAALSLLALRGSAIWRRLMVIAFEDIGAGSAEVLDATVAAGTDSTWRRASGGDVPVAIHLARVLAEAPKDRSSDYLICGAKDHPSMMSARRACEFRSITENLSAVADQRVPLVDRAMAAWFAGGIERRESGDLPALLDTFRALGTPEELVAATSVAAARTREPIVIMVPLVWLAANADRQPTVCETPVPATVVVDGVPLYAMDKHTRLGREATRRFARENDAARAQLEAHVPANRRSDAACMAAFYTDAAPVAKRLMWQGTAHVETYGTEADMHKAGVPLEAIAPVLQAFRDNLPHLNDVRAEIFARGRAEIR
jgi:hypothetical protein